MDTSSAEVVDFVRPSPNAMKERRILDHHEAIPAQKNQNQIDIEFNRKERAK
jgi:hypothetical protein